MNGFHGKCVYDKRIAQLSEVAERAEISHLCTNIHKSFEDRVDEYKHKYE